MLLPNWTTKEQRINSRKMTETLSRAFLVFTIYVSVSEALNCPNGCNCKWISANLHVDCSGSHLSLAPDFEDLPVEVLDLSKNDLREFPSELSAVNTLTSLDLSGNAIQYLNSAALKGFTSLNTLILDENRITNWRSLNPNHILLPAVNLHTLSFARNPINSFSSNSEEFLLMSHSLKILDLTNCNITKIFGRFVLQGLTDLERLILNENPLRSISHLTSNSLRILDLSNCGLGKLHPNAFTELTQLTSLDLSRNPGLSLSMKSDEFVFSDSLMHLDLSYCNMDSVDIAGFPNSKFINLKGNLIRKLSDNTFVNNNLLETIDLSNNAIDDISLDAFFSLKLLKFLDLSFNMISRIDRNIFSKNDVLTTVNLSKNFLSRFSKITGKSVSQLNLSGCEILTVDQNALSGLPNLVKLDLSYNLISHFPDLMRADTLQFLDLNMNRLSSIRNTTFFYYPELETVKLSGNRLTTPLRVEFFKGNPYLSKIWIGDNPWRCECEDKSFLQFYTYITQRPSKISDKYQLKCAGPNDFYGKSWEQACFRVWFQQNKISTSEKVWSVLMGSIIVLCVLLCAFVSIKRAIAKKKRNRNQRELRANLDEQREIIRQNRIMMDQEAQLNAPDPRETLPPCYEDALLMPRLERNFKSMDELNTRRTKRKTVNSKDIGNEELVLDHCRFRSEEMLSVRDRERTFNILSTRRTAKIPQSRSGSGLLFSQDSRFTASYLKSKNLESAELIANFQSHENSPYSKRRRKSGDNQQDILPPSFSGGSKLPMSGSIDVIKSFDSIERSPYSIRKPQNLLKGKHSISQWTLSSGSETALDHTSNINLVEGYFSKPSSGGNVSSDFQIMNPNDGQLTPVRSVDSIRSDPIVIVHRQDTKSEQYHNDK